jgi:2-oxo-4-hydroxy-4-carboxy--5-ureidoimidazoline (OHCU) decarboxylase
MKKRIHAQALTRADERKAEAAEAVLDEMQRIGNMRLKDIAHEYPGVAHLPRAGACQ